MFLLKRTPAINPTHIHTLMVSSIEAAKHDALVSLNFRLSTRILQIFQRKITDKDARVRRKFYQDINLILTNTDFRDAMKSYIHMDRERVIYSILDHYIPTDILGHVAEYSRHLPEKII